MKALLTLAVAAAVLLAAWHAFKPDPGQQPVPSAPAPQQPSLASEPPAADTPQAPAEPAQAQHVAVTIELRGQRLRSGPEVIRVRQGQTVALTVLSDRADELHLHGYDLTLPLAAGVPATLQLETTRSGRFEYEIHSAHASVGALEVYPASN